MTAQAQRARSTLARRRKELANLRQTNLADEAEAEQARSPDWTDRAAERESADVSERLSELERRELLDIDAALDRLRRGNYGRCDACAGAIGRQRLAAVPQARYCIRCEAAQEHA